MPDRSHFMHGEFLFYHFEAQHDGSEIPVYMCNRFPELEGAEAASIEGVLAWNVVRNVNLVYRGERCDSPFGVSVRYVEDSGGIWVGDERTSFAACARGDEGRRCVLTIIRSHIHPNNPPYQRYIGTHETGHALGLADLYQVSNPAYYCSVMGIRGTIQPLDIANLEWLSSHAHDSRPATTTYSGCSPGPTPTPTPTPTIVLRPGWNWLFWPGPALTVDALLARFDRPAEIIWGFDWRAVVWSYYVPGVGGTLLSLKADDFIFVFVK